MRTKFDEDLIQEEKHEQILLSDLKNLEQLQKSLRIMKRMNQQKKTKKKAKN